MANDSCALVDTQKLVRLILDQIADKWSILVIAALCREPMRFHMLRRDIDAVTKIADDGAAPTGALRHRCTARDSCVACRSRVQNHLARRDADHALPSACPMGQRYKAEVEAVQQRFDAPRTRRRASRSTACSLDHKVVAESPIH